MSIILSSLNIYPVKSLQGTALGEAEVQDRGLQLDRRWIIVDQEGMAVTQRKHPQMALIKVEITEQGLQLNAPDMPLLEVNFGENTGKTCEAEVWGTRCTGVEVSAVANQWLSDYLKMPLQLVYMPDDTKRLVEKEYNINNHITSFSDAYPFLLISEASLAELNTRLEQPVPMNRFRPNLVVSGTEAFAEDTWKKIRIGEVIFHVVKGCGRCVFTTVDQETGIKGTEPLRTLAQYRKVGKKVIFGQNLLQEGNGTLKVGDKLEVLEIKDSVEA